ncbi:MAG: hypothetical protein ACK5HP_02620 [Bacilli bacterium]
MKKNNYIVSKTNSYGDLIVIDYSKINGLKLAPKDGLDYPGVSVNSFTIIKPSFIEKALKRKIKIKLNYYFQNIISFLDDDDSNQKTIDKYSDEEDDGTRYMEVLNDLTRYKNIVEYKYKKFLDDKYISFLQKKISVLENEIKSKIINQNLVIQMNAKKIMNSYPIYEEVQEKGKSR